MKVLIIGGVAAGASAAARLRRLDESCHIIMFERGPYMSYANCGIPYHLGGVIAERDDLMVMSPHGFAARFNVDVRMESEAVRIDRERKEVEIAPKNGKTCRESYDKLVIATGSSPVLPAIPGADLKDRNPDEEFMCWILKSEDGHGKMIYQGVVNMNVIARFQPIIKNALTRVIRDIVRRSITAMDEEVTKADEFGSTSPVIPDSPIDTPSAETPSESGRKTVIITTEDELALFEKVKAIYAKVASEKQLEVYEPSLRRMIPAEIGYKDTSAYFGIYINKPSWWLMRASIESKSKWLGFDLPMERVQNALPDSMTMLSPSAMAETRVSISSIEDITKLENLILMAIDYELQKHQINSEPEEPPVFLDRESSGE